MVQYHGIIPVQAKESAMNEETKHQPTPYRERGRDRRSRTGIEPPPFMTREGLVEVERRSPFDRRATWLREFSIDIPAVSH